MTAPTHTLYEPGYLVAGKYQLESELGQGGMGIVWRARNIALDSPVAIKVVRAASDKVNLSGRLIQEARAAAKLTHPAIVKVFDVGQTENGDPFIVMELLEGDSLGRLLETGGRLPAVQAVQTLLPIIDALWLAHGKGIVHRDLKPDNVFIVQHEGAIQPTLVDFGIVKVQGTEAESHLTNAGDVLGSPDYMSPEQARGQDDVTHLTDIWSICVVLYETIAGRTPFKGANYNALLRQIVEDAPPSLRDLAAADAELSTIVARGLSKQPEERPASMGALGRQLATWLLQQGVTEDICGSTLETKWLRGTDPHGRAGRATLASINDGWQVEQGSGVRKNQLGPINTLPAPPIVGNAGEPATIAALAVEPVPDARPKWRLAVGALAVMALMFAGFVLGRRLLSAEIAPALSAAHTPNEAAPAPSTPAVVASSPPAVMIAPLATSEEKAAPSVDEQVSSSAGRTSGGVHGARPARPVPPKRASGAGKATAKPGDLLSPY
jgi:eukaryotic-like serine/threonine-protein kinase